MCACSVPGSVPTVVLTHPDVIREALGKDELSERRITAHTNMSAERGLMFAVYPEPWQQLNQIVRERLLSTQSSAALSRDQFGPVMDRTMESVGAAADAGEVVAPQRLMLSSAYDLCLDALFGKDGAETGELRAVREELVENVTRYCAAAFSLAYKLMIAYPDLKFLFRRLLNKSLAQRERRDSLIGRLVEDVERRRTAGTEPACLVDAMLDGESSGDLSRSATLALCVDVLVNTAAIASTVGWTLLLVANRPEVQAGIQQEMDSVVGRDASPDEDHRTLLPYTFACIAESMRFRPVSPLSLPRLATADTETGGCRIPAGAQVFAGIHSVHHDERFWDSPEEFIPERFLPQADGSPSAALASPAYNGPSAWASAAARAATSPAAPSGFYVTRMFHLFQFELPAAGAALSEEEVFDLFVSPHPLRPESESPRWLAAGSRKGENRIDRVPGQTVSPPALARHGRLDAPLRRRRSPSR